MCWLHHAIKIKEMWKKRWFFSSCKNQELASFEKLLTEKLSSDIIHLALKCHLEIKHEDALFRKHQNNLFQGKKKKVLCLEARITKFNEVHAYWQTRLVYELFSLFSVMPLKLPACPESEEFWFSWQQPHLSRKKAALLPVSLFSPGWCARDGSCLLRTVIWVC